MSNLTDRALTAVWLKLKEILIDDPEDALVTEVWKQFQTPKDTKVPYVTCGWFSEVREDTHYNIDKTLFQIVVWDESPDGEDTNLSEIVDIIDNTFETIVLSRVLNPEDAEEDWIYAGSLALDRDNMNMTRGYDNELQQWFVILRYNAIIG